jgi:hypothetical protein
VPEDRKPTPQVLSVVNIQVIHALALEINTGLKLSARGSALQAAKIQRLVPETCRSKKKALEICIAEMKKKDPDYEPSPSVKRALQK